MIGRLPWMLLVAAAAPLQAQAPAAQQPAAAGALIGPAMYVTDVERSLAFYAKALGMQVNLRMGPANRRETILGFDQDPSKPAIILLSDESAAAPRRIEHGHGYDRLAMRVRDLPAVVARLRAAGFAASDVRDVAQGYRMAIATDPDGYELELVERAGSEETTR